MTKDEAARMVITFGKYKGHTFGEVYGEDPGYLEWCVDSLDPEKWGWFLKACTAFGIENVDDMENEYP